MPLQLELGDIVVDVVYKDIKRLNLRVYQPLGGVSISAPRQMSMDVIQSYALSKLDWIRKTRQKVLAHAAATQDKSMDQDALCLWGKRYSLAIAESDGPPAVSLQDTAVVLHLRPGTSARLRQAVIEEWYREQVSNAMHPLLAKWTALLGVSPAGVSLKRMKTRWGSCASASRRICLNLDLAKEHPECLEYVVAHELVHLLEPSHGARFAELMDRHMPKWRLYKQELRAQSQTSPDDWEC
jgi:predicted metal-dependent hydrolase